MRAVAIAFFLLMTVPFGYGRQRVWHQLPPIAVEEVDLVSLDNRGRIFYSDTKGNVFKLGEAGEVRSRYSPPIQGRLNQLDAFQTMILFLFSADLQQVTLLDSHLAPIQNIPFQDEDIGLVKAAALGNNHVFWLFDEVDLSLKKYDYRSGQILQVQSLVPLVGDNTIEVIEILERKNLVLMNIKDRGLFVFDNQGNFIRKHDVLLPQPLAVHDGLVYFVQNDALHRLNIYSGEENVSALPDVRGDRVAVSAQRLVIYSSDSLFPLAVPGF